MIVSMAGTQTLDDLMRFDGKGELIAGKVVEIVASGDRPNDAAFEIAVSLRAYAKATGVGVAKSDGMGYAFPAAPRTGRQSFAPDASYYTGPRPVNGMRFIEGPPTLAVEVRSENDYGPAAERAIESKRREYFAFGTLAVWDVDPEAETVTAYRHDDPDAPRVFRRGEIADAEPAAPGWTMTVDDVFGPPPAP